MSEKQEQRAVAKRPEAEFRQLAVRAAKSLLTEWVGEDRAAEAVGRVSTALAAAAAGAKNPRDFYECTPSSIATVVAISALTGVMVGTGAGALAYAIPRRPRQGATPQLTYQLSHRGICALAERSGSKVVPIPIGFGDEIDVTADGEVRVGYVDVDNPPTTEDELRGVIVLVKDRQTGRVLFTGYVPRKLINIRRAVSQDWKYSGDKSIWGTWYVEQAMKTAIHYAAARGWVVLDDSDAQRALSIDVAADVAPTAKDAPKTIGEVIDVDPVDDTTGEVAEPVE